MGQISDFLRRRSCRKKVSAWRIESQSALEITWFPPAINGVRFRSPIDDAHVFGKPDEVDVCGKAGISFRFLRHGLELLYEQDSLAWFAVILRPQDDIPPKPSMAAASVSFVCRGCTALSRNTTVDELIGLFGRPVDEDVDEDERVMTQVADGYTVESEFTVEGGLKRLNVFPNGSESNHLLQQDALTARR